jgi:ABC-2 type transport system permease protein
VILHLQTLNPVLDRELRQRSRSKRSVVLVTLFLALLTGVLFLAYKGSQSTAQFTSDPISALTIKVGRTMFEWVLAAQLVILLFMIPGISAGAIAGERDRQTLIPLQVTLVGPIQIFVGKVLASSSFILLLVVASAPIMAIPYLVGGISLSNVIRALVALLIIGFLMAVIGVSCSAIFRRTQTATLAAYFMVLVLTLGTVVGLVVLAVIDASRGSDTVEPRLVALYPNPFVAIADAAGEIGSPSNGPFSPVKQVFLEAQLGPNATVITDQIAVEGPGGVFGGGGGRPIVIDQNTGQPLEVNSTWSGVPLWIRSLGVQAAVALALAVPAVRRLRAPQKELYS